MAHRVGAGSGRSGGSGAADADRAGPRPRHHAGGPRDAGDPAAAPPAGRDPRVGAPARRGALIAVALLLAAACGGGEATTKSKGPKQPDIDQETAAADASGHVEELYSTLEGGNKDSLFSLLADPLYVFGPRRADAMATRADVLTALGELVDKKEKRKVKLKSESLGVVVSKGGRSAWATDVVQVNGTATAATFVLTNADDLWLVETVVVGETPTPDDLAKALGDAAIVPPGAKADKAIAADAKDAVAKFQAGLLDQAQWGEELMARADAVVIGPAEGEVARGKKAIKKLWKQRMEAKTRLALSGEIAAAVTPDGRLAWVSAPVTRAAEERDPVPVRAFAIYEQDGDAWSLAALHELVALDEPGAGTKFMKILPPAVAEPPPPEEAAPPPEEEQPKKKKKKKKKLKKKKRVDEDEDDGGDE